MSSSDQALDVGGEATIMLKLAGLVRNAQLGSNFLTLNDCNNICHKPARTGEERCPAMVEPSTKDNKAIQQMCCPEEPYSTDIT